MCGIGSGTSCRGSRPEPLRLYGGLHRRRVDREELMKAERVDYAAAAWRAASAVAGADVSEFAPARMTKFAHWFEDSSRGSLIAVIPPGEKVTAADEVLAYGLAWQHDRDLLLVVPDPMVVPLLTRMAWLETEVRLFHFDGPDDGVPRPVSAVSRFQLLSHLTSLPVRVPKVGALRPEHQTWVDGIALDALSAHDRGGYLSWHFDGLQVLQIRETRSGMRVTAGVQYSNPPPGREPFDKTFTSAPTPADTAVINAKIELAIQDGGSLTSRMREHKMQATLTGQPDALNLTNLWREFPAWRGLTSSSVSGSGRPGFIDFLGADSTGVLHVVETKIGHDPKVVLQALDYAIWVTANETSIRAQLMALGHAIPTPSRDPLTSSRPAPIHLVLGADGAVPAFNGYLAGQIEALAGDCKISIHVTANPTATPLTLQRLHATDMWTANELVAAPVMGPRWPGALTTALAGS